MVKTFKYFGLVLLCLFCVHIFCDDICIYNGPKKSINKLKLDKEKLMDAEKGHVFKKTLKNGMTILVRVVRTIPKVALQVWYNVGSKDEKSGEKGIAHLIEHMIFKGTDTLSESDISAITHKLSGSCNAFTSYDYTGYRFDIPTHHWKKILPVISDCMINASFKDDHLDSEMKAVIQELKMINDSHMRSLAYKMLTLIFAGHPYHYPLIGYKQDLWTVKGEDLRAFYEKHYHPGNATLVVAGDVDPEEVFTIAKQSFEKIPQCEDYKKEEFLLGKDIESKKLTIYRDVKSPKVLLSFLIPGEKEKLNYLLEIVGISLFNNKSSRLHKKLIDDLQLATEISAFDWSLFEHGIFFVLYEPKSVDDIEKIESIIFEEIQDVAQKGLKKNELERSSKNVRMHYYSKLENIEQQALDIGKSFLATGDENYPFNYMNLDFSQIQDGVQKLLGDFFRKTIAHRGVILPLPEIEKEKWKKLQEESDALDTKILSARVRTTSVEEPKHVHEIQMEEPGVFNFPKPQTFTTSNGSKIFYAHNDNTPKINLVISFKARGYYDDDEKPGLYNFVMNMLSEGTKNYSAQELADEIESRGMSFHASPGMIEMSMLSEDFEKGLEILEEILSRATFDKREMKKVREQIYANIRNFWDSPMGFSSQIVREQIYEGHPYSKNILGTDKSVKSIKQKDLKNFYKKFISPHGAKISIVGDLSGYDLPVFLEEHLSSWVGPEVDDVVFPELTTKKEKVVDHYINRDQVVLCFAGLSVDRKHSDYDKLWLFDQIFGGGVLGSMNSRLMKLREQSGLFYVIGGSLKSGANEQPGMVQVKTIISLDRLEEAQDVIKKTIDTAVQKIEEQEFELARLAIANAIVGNFESNSKIASTFLFLDRYDLPLDYFDKRAEELAKLTIPEVQKAVKKVLDSKNMITVRIGRVGEKEDK